MKWLWCVGCGGNKDDDDDDAAAADQQSPTRCSVLTTEAHFVPVEVLASAGRVKWPDVTAAVGAAGFLLAEDVFERQKQQAQHHEEKVQNTSTFAPSANYRRSCPTPVFTQRYQHPEPLTSLLGDLLTRNACGRYRAFGFVSAHEILQRISGEEVHALASSSISSVSLRFTRCLM
jgi:hypothetical protein